MQTYLLVLSWTASTCLLRLFFWAALYSHCSHWWSFSMFMFAKGPFGSACCHAAITVSWRSLNPNVVGQPDAEVGELCGFWNSGKKQGWQRFQNGDRLWKCNRGHDWSIYYPNMVYMPEFDLTCKILNQLNLQWIMHMHPGFPWTLPYMLLCSVYS